MKRFRYLTLAAVIMLFVVLTGLLWKPLTGFFVNPGPRGILSGCGCTGAGTSNTDNGVPGAFGVFGFTG